MKVDLPMVFLKCMRVNAEKEGRHMNVRPQSCTIIGYLP